jgi:hypothetical protein
MSDWDFTGDQYRSDMDARYPLFSDIQTTDQSIVAARPLPRKMSECSCEGCVTARSKSQKPKDKSPRQVTEKMAVSSGPTKNDIDNNTILIIFMFIIVIFICTCSLRLITDLQAKVNSLELMLKK